MKILFISFCVLYFLSSIMVNGSFLTALFGASDVKTDEFPDYSDVQFEDIDFEMDEISFDVDEYKAKIEACIKTCIEKNPNEKFKSNCVQKTCEIYRK